MKLNEKKIEISNAFFSTWARIRQNMVKIQKFQVGVILVISFDFFPKTHSKKFSPKLGQLVVSCLIKNDAENKQPIDEKVILKYIS